MRALARAISWARSAMSYSPSGHGEGAEGVGLDHVGADLEVGGVEGGDHVGAGDAEDVGAALERGAAVVVEAEVLGLQPGARGAVVDDDPLRHHVEEAAHRARLPSGRRRPGRRSPTGAERTGGRDRPARTGHGYCGGHADHRGRPDPGGPRRGDPDPHRRDHGRQRAVGPDADPDPLPRATPRPRTPSSPPSTPASTSGCPGSSAYAFSTENWSRDLEEIAFLMRFDEWLLRKERRDELNEKGVQIRFLGRLDDPRIPRGLTRLAHRDGRADRPQHPDGPRHRVQLRRPHRAGRRRPHPDRRGVAADDVTEDVLASGSTPPTCRTWTW